MAEKSRVFQRHQWLIGLIQRSNGITLSEIMQAWERSPLNAHESEYTARTFHRHKNEIEEIYGISIRYDRSSGCYYIDNEGDMGEGGVQDWMLSTIAIDNMLSESRDLRDRIQFEAIPGGRQHLNTIIAAMREGKVLNMTYKSYTSPEEKFIPLEPYFIKVFEQRWYVIGRSQNHTETTVPRVYALDRITDLEMSGVDFSYPKDFDPVEFYNYSYGIFRMDEKPQIIKLKATPRQAMYMDSLPIHKSQTKILDECTDEYSIYELFLTPALDFVQYLCSQGAGLEVLEPQSLRDRVSGELAQALEKYGKR